VEGITKEADAVVCNFSGTPDSIKAATDMLFGKIKQCPKTKLPVKLDDQYEAPVKKPVRPKKSSLVLSYC
jgi:hypothetical protein